MTLSDMFEMRAGKFIAASEISSVMTSERPIPCFGGGGPRGFVAHPSHRGERLLIGRQGALCGAVRRASGAFYATEHAVVAEPRPGIHVGWAFHMLTAMDLNQYATKSAQPGLAVGTIASLRVAVPDHGDQQRLAGTLDRFDALTTGVGRNLSAEIAARRKQYEFYRDKLLSFEEAA